MKPISAVLLCAVLPLVGCSSTQRDASSREWARAECNRVIDQADRERCLRRADDAYGPAGERREPAPR